MDQLEIAISRTAHQFAERIIEKGHREEVLLGQLKDLAAVQNALIQINGMLGDDKLEPLFEFVQNSAGRSAESHLARAKAGVKARQAQNGAPRFT